MKNKLLLLIVILICAFLFFFMRNDKSGRLDVQLRGDSFFEGLRIVNKKNGATEWVLTARRADLSKDGNEADLTGVEMKIEGKGITVSADKGLYQMTTKTVTIDGPVTAKNNNYTITARHATIDGTVGLIETDGDVTIEGRKFSLEGKGMTADSEEQKVRILRDVKATFH